MNAATSAPAIGTAVVRTIRSTVARIVQYSSAPKKSHHFRRIPFLVPVHSTVRTTALLGFLVQL